MTHCTPRSPIIHSVFYSPDPLSDSLVRSEHLLQETSGVDQWHQSWNGFTGSFHWFLQQLIGLHNWVRKQTRAFRQTFWKYFRSEGNLYALAQLTHDLSSKYQFGWQMWKTCCCFLSKYLQKRDVNVSISQTSIRPKTFPLPLTSNRRTVAGTVKH